MKKLLPILFLAFGCSSNEMEETEQEQVNDVDPLIGTWNFVLSDNIMDQDGSSVIFKSDGTFTEQNPDGVTDDGGIWENKGDNFNDEVQTYVLEYYGLATGEADIENGTEIIATFEERFTRVTLRNEEDDITIRLLRMDIDIGSDNSSNQSQNCSENDIIGIINSFKEQDINTTYDFPFGEYNLFQRYGGSIPSGGTFNGISYLSVDFFSDANQTDNGIWVSYNFREDNGELIFGYVGIRSTDSSGEVSWSNIRRYYAPTYESDGQDIFETSSICEFWEEMNSYIKTLSD